MIVYVVREVYSFVPAIDNELEDETQFTRIVAVCSSTDMAKTFIEQVSQKKMRDCAEEGIVVERNGRNVLRLHDSPNGSRGRMYMYLVDDYEIDTIMQ